MLSFALYINTLGHDFALDDAIVISENMFTQDGIAGWGGLLTEDTFYGYFKEEGKAQLVAGGRYRPLSPMLFALVYQIVGKNPFVFHLLNILLYCLCVWMVYGFISLIGKRLKVKSHELFAFIATLIFATHAVHTEVVANIKGGDEILVAIGGIAALIFMLRYQEKQEIKYLLLTLVSFFLSLMAKENTVTLLAIAPLTWWLTAPKGSKGMIKTWFSMFAVFLVYFIIRSSIVGWPWDTVVPNELLNNPFLKFDGNSLVSFTTSEKFGTNFYTLLMYLKLLIFPHPLIHDYYPRQIPIFSMTSIWALLSLALHVAMAAWAILRINKNKVLAYGILFYLFAMSITSNFVFPIGTNMSERFLFFPSIGFCIVAGFLINKLIKKNKIIGWGLLLLFVSLLSIKTIERNPAWKDNFTLFQTDVKRAPNSAKLRNAAAGSLVTRYGDMKEGEEKSRIMQEAIDHAEAALQVHPWYKNAHLLKGNGHLYRNEFDQGIQSFNNALKLDPNYKIAKSNLQIAMRSAGRYYGETEGNLEKSLKFLKQSYEMNPKDPEVVRLLGVAYGMKGTHTKAIQYFNELVELRPENAQYLKMLGMALHQNGQTEDGDAVLRKAKKMNPELFKK